MSILKTRISHVVEFRKTRNIQFIQIKPFEERK